MLFGNRGSSLNFDNGNLNLSYRSSLSRSSNLSSRHRHTYASSYRVSDKVCQQAHGANGIIVCRDTEIDVVRIAVRVQRAHNGDV